MKKILLFIMSMIFIISFSSCKNGDTPNDGVPQGIQTSTAQIYGDDVVNDKVTYTGFYEDGLQYDFTYKDEYFKASALENNTELAKLSLLNSLASTNYVVDGNYDNAPKYLYDFYTKCHFYDISSSYYHKPSKNSIGFVSAKKMLKFDDQEYMLIAISIRGFKYEAEWASNFTIGSDSNHSGFDSAACDIFDQINAMTRDYDKNKIKIWISGYSRAGAVAGLAGTIIDYHQLANKENIYIYTFEAPASYGLGDYQYGFIHNYVNPNDVVTKMLNRDIDLCRPGVDIDYVTGKDINKVKENLSKISKKVELHELKNIDSLSEFLLGLFSELYDSGKLDRNIYVDKYQESFAYIFEFYFGLDSNKQNALIEYFKGLSMIKILSFLSVDSATEEIDKVFTEKGIEYDKEKMKKVVTDLLDLVTNVIVPSVGTNIAKIIDNIMPIAENHFAEVSLAYIMA